MHPAVAMPDFLSFLASPEGRALRAGFHQRSLRRGEVLALPGTARDEVLVLCRGRVRVHTTDGRRELTLMFLEPGDVFATHTGATLTAAGAVEFLTMPTRQFARALETGGTPAVVSVMRVLGRLLAHTVARLEDLVFRDVHSRLARLLLALVRRQGLRQPSGQWRCAMPFTLTDLAGVLGTSRQSVSAAFAVLERQGVVTREGRRWLCVPDLAALEYRTVSKASPS